MPSTSENNKRIAKNAALLYVRMFLVLTISLYTSRVVLKALGVEDFGIYNVVGGIVTMLGFLNNSLNGATSRFITFELGCGTVESLRKVFRCSMSIHYLLAFLIFILAETVGLWLVLEKLVIPVERMQAALWVYQCSVVTVIVFIISAPYNALIVAHERMGVFAYISIFETVSKLIVVLFLTQVSSMDKLILYAVLLLAIQIIIRFIYTFYCSRHFPETSARFLWNKELSKRMFVYTSWTLNGDLAIAGYTQGLNILLNMFFGPSVNAARAISVQVQTAVTQFFSSFQTAVRPQIIKSYAQHDLSYMHTLIIYSSKYSFYLLLLVSMPLLVNTEYVLHLWLGQVPEHSVTFTRLMLLVCMDYALRFSTIIAIHATGDIKKFQLIEGTLLLTVVPVAYVLLKFGSISAEMVFVVYLLIETLTQAVRIWIVCPRVRLSRRLYAKEVLLPIFWVLLFLMGIGYGISQYTVDSIISLAVSILFCFLSTILVIGLVGLNGKERSFLKEKVIARIER